MLRHPRLHHSRESNPLPKKTPGSPLTAHVPHLRFSFRSSSATGQYIYIQLVGPERYLWLGEVMAELSDAPSPAPSCASDGSQYVSGGSCVDCPANSVSTGADATFCTCVDNYSASEPKDVNSPWTCVDCPTGQSKTGSKVPSESGESETCGVSCSANQYFVTGDGCSDCPSTSTSSDVASEGVTSCTCPADTYVAWANKDGGSWSCTACKLGQTKAATAIPSADGTGTETASACGTATCADDHYLVEDPDAAELKYCVACPDDSTSTEAASTACRCPDNEYAEWSNGGGGSWSCESCPDGTVKSGGSLIPQASEASDTCNGDCPANKYFADGSCQSCPDNSNSAGGTATTCTCAANYWAKKSGSTWTCELCSGGRTKAAGSTILSGSGEVEDDVCISHSDGYGDCECYCDGSYQGIIPVDDGVPESFCDGPGGAASQCQHMGGFTCANTFTVNWVYNSAYQGTNFGGGDSGYPPPPSWEEGYPPPPPTECTTEQYFDGSACQTCPDGSESTGGTAEYCTCAANTYASKSGNTWTCANCTGGGTKEAGSVVPGSGSGEKENDVCSTADSSGSNNPSPSQQSPSPSQKATETKEEAQKTRDTMLNGVTDAKLKKKAKLLADAAISGKKVRKMSAKLTASDANTACSDYYTKAGISSSLGACIATATSRRRSLAATAYDVSVFFSEAEVDDSTLTSAANSLKAEGVTGVDTSDPIDPITELGTIAGVDSSTLETFKTEAAEAAAMTPSSQPPPPMSPPPPKPAPPNLILDDDDGAVSVKGATRLALACALTTLALVF